MKVYIKSATNVADIEAKIAKKQAEIDKKQAWVAKKEAAIQKKLDLLKPELSSEEYDKLVNYLELLKTTYSSKIPSESSFDLWGIARKRGWDYESPKGKACYSIDDDAESIYNSNYTIKEAEAIRDKYVAQLNAIKEKDRRVDEIPEVMKEFMNQLIDEWDRFDKNIRDNSKVFYDECKARMNELVPNSLYSKERREKLFELYPEYRERYDRAERFNRLYVEYDMRDTFENEYLNIPFKREFGVSVEYARNLWGMTDEQIHANNVKEGKRVILDLTDRVTKITGPITSYAGLRLTQGNGGWAVLNGYVVGEDGKASVESILAGGYAIQRLHVRTLVKEIH